MAGIGVGMVTGGTASAQIAAGAQAVQFRWEVFNVINHVNFASVPAGTNAVGLVTALNSASFGQIQAAGDPRIMQFALKFTF